MITRRAYVIVDLGFGDSGKGTIVDALARRVGASLVVRYNGGPQAGHNVVTRDGRHHTFSQWGAGTFAGVPTYLSEYMMIDPAAMEPEAEHLEQQGVADPWDLLSVDDRCLVVTPFHRAVNRIRELARGDRRRHGSCGMGVGEAYVDAQEGGGHALRASDLHSRPLVLANLHAIRKRMLDKARRIESAGPATGWVEGLKGEMDVLTSDEAIEAAADVYVRVARKVHLRRGMPGHAPMHDAVVYEGAQGVLLDAERGFHPHTTWSCATSRNAQILIERTGTDPDVQTIGVVRAYATRHGAGPFPTESAISHADSVLRGEHNVENAWQGSLRIGAFDAVLARYAIAVDQCVDVLAVTCLDKLVNRAFCSSYRLGDSEFESLPPAHGERDTAFLGAALRHVEPVLRQMPPGEDFAALIGELLRLRVAITSHGPCAEDKIWEMNL